MWAMSGRTGSRSRRARAPWWASTAPCAEALSTACLRATASLLERVCLRATASLLERVCLRATASLLERVCLRATASLLERVACRRSELPAVAGDGLLVGEIGRAEFCLEIAFLAQHHAVMQHEEGRHEQDRDPVRAEHEREAEDRDQAAEIDGIARMREEARGDDRSGRLVGADIGAGRLEGAPHADRERRAEQEQREPDDEAGDMRQRGEDAERHEIIEQEAEHEDAEKNQRRKDDDARS